jgi:hypothetical protein
VQPNRIQAGQVFVDKPLVHNGNWSARPRVVQIDGTAEEERNFERAKKI